MNFKKPKEQVIRDAETAANIRLSNAMGDIKYNISIKPEHLQILDQLQWSIATAIGTAIRSVVDDMYTDQDFEEDMTLRDK